MTIEQDPKAMPRMRISQKIQMNLGFLHKTMINDILFII